MFNKETQIICAGFGGQGVLTIGLILANTAMDLGAEVTWIPAYGAEMRGGTASCSVKISNKRIGSPFIREMDVLIALNEPSLDKYEQDVKQGGCIIVNSNIVGNRSYRDDVNVYSLDADSVATDLGNVRGAGVAMIGALVKCTGLFTKEQTAEGVQNFFKKKGKVNTLNDACFHAGFEHVKCISK